MTIAIIGVLASIILTSMSIAREKARDSKRISSVRQILTALEAYNTTYGVYPDSDDDSGDPSCGGVPVPPKAPTDILRFDCSHVGTFLSALEPFMDGDVPVDPLNTGNYVFGYYKGNDNISDTCPGGTVRAILVIGQFEQGDGAYTNPDPCGIGNAHWITVLAQ